MSRALALPIALALLALGCNDKAQPAYDACLEAEKNSDYPLAVKSCEAAIAADPTSTAGKAAAEKATEIHRKLDEMIPPTVTPDFCARLRRRLEPRLQAEIEAKAENTDRDFVRKTAHETVNAYVTKLERECNQAAGRSATGYWTCAWNESFDNPKQCDALRAAERATGGGGTPSSGPATQPEAATTAADTIRAHPDIISIVPDEWQTRISATITGDAAESCPALKFVRWKDEFERREKQDGAAASCGADNQKALAFAKTCPLVATLNVKLSEYDFDAKKFRITVPSHGSADTVLVTSPGRVYVPDGRWLLTWAGPHVRSDGAGLPNGGCVGALNDAIPQLAGFTLDLPMPESDARAFHTQMQGSLGFQLEVAFLAAGTAAQEDIVCDMRTPNAAEGVVIAWRLLTMREAGPNLPYLHVTLLDWTSTGAWPAPDSCDGERSFYGLSAGSLGKAAKTVKTQCPARTTAASVHMTACGCYQDTTEVGVVTRPRDDCEQEPKTSGRDCIWRCR